jgi:hypothetical protein
MLDANLDVCKHASRCSAMKVSAAVEGLNHGLTRCHVSKDAQLQLTIVSHGKRTPHRSLECLADEVSVLLQRRLVLQIRPAAGQSSCLCVQIQTAVHTPILH